MCVRLVCKGVPFARASPKSAPRTKARPAAIDRARAAAKTSDAADTRRRHAPPIDPTAERIVQRHAVRENDRAARTACADAAQTDALRGRIRRATASAAEQLEACDLPERVV